MGQAKEQADQLVSGRVSTGIAIYLLGMFSMSVMDASAKWLTVGYAIVQLVFFESLFAMLPVSLVLKREGLLSLVTRRWPLLLLRGCFSLGIIFFFFFSLKFLPLANVVAVFSVAPLFMVMLAIPILGERIGLPDLAAVMAGFLGALLIIRPTGADFDQAALLPLGAAVCYAIVMILSRILVKTETTAAVLCYDYLVTFGVSALLLPFFWSTPSVGDLGIFILMGVTGALGSYWRTRACKYAPVNVLAPFDYSGLVWAVIFGYAIWREVPDTWTAIGALAIATGGIFIVKRQR